MTTENPKTEDQEVMPSFFPHINQSESHRKYSVNAVLHTSKNITNFARRHCLCIF